MQKFVIRYIYNDKKSQSLPESRASKWRALKRKTRLRIPPDEDTLQHHIQRANYQAFVWLSCKDSPPAPSPLQHGWTQESGRILPIKHYLPPLPRNLQQLLVATEVNDESSSDPSSESEADQESDTEICDFDESDSD